MFAQPGMAENLALALDCVVEHRAVQRLGRSAAKRSGAIVARVDRAAHIVDRHAGKLRHFPGDGAPELYTNDDHARSSVVSPVLVS